MTEQQITRVLVTGATGFLGSNILKAMADNPRIECIAACRNRSKLPAHFSGEVRVGDLLDPEYRRNLVNGYRCHLSRRHLGVDVESRAPGARALFRANP